MDYTFIAISENNISHFSLSLLWDENLINCDVMKPLLIIFNKASFAP